MKISVDLLDPTGQWNDILNWVLKLVWLNSWQDFQSWKPDFDDQISSRAKFKVSAKVTIFTSESRFVSGGKIFFSTVVGFNN